MSNPTLGNQSQFTAPFNILPDVIYTNPTANTAQFKAPYPPIGPPRTYVNPTRNNPQFISTYTAFSGYYTGNPYNTVKDLPRIADRAMPVYDGNSEFFKSSFIRNSSNGKVWTAMTPEASNITLSSIGASALSLAGSAVASLVGIPQLSQAVNSFIGPQTSTYATLTANQTKPIPGVKYADFRNRRVIENPGAATLLRLDGAAAFTRTGNARTGLFAAASANPLGGAYAVFNLDGASTTGYGWGSHDATTAIRNDFTLKSHVSKRWNKDLKIWEKTKRFPDLGIPFRGDRVNVIDFGQRTEENAYRWHSIPGPLGLTQDFIKFYFTGPKLRPGLYQPDVRETTSELDIDRNTTDDIIVFRATISSLSDQFNAQWAAQNMIGRADPNYQYKGFERSLSLDFTVYATDRDELQPIWRKLNALAGYTAPIYNSDITMAGPWMRITIGDLFRQTPVVLTDLTYTLHDQDSTWETNIEADVTNMQVPHRVEVKCGFNIIGNEVPQNNGKFYTLAKRFDPNTGESKTGDDNWLSDFKGNSAATGSLNESWIKRDRDKGTVKVTS
jgi:hypothetical protein